MTSTLSSRLESIPESLHRSVPSRSGDESRATILVATDGTERSDGAIRLAAARAAASGAAMEVMIVLEAELHLSSDDGHFGESRLLYRRTARRRAVDEQIQRVLGEDRPCAISVFDGNPAFTISRVAIERRAALIVVGIGRHQLADRIFSDETALQLARVTRIPVLAVPADVSTMPRRAVVAIDFSEISTRAAQSAVEAVAEDGRVDLVHVMPSMGEGAFAIEAEPAYTRWVQEQLAGIAEQLVVPAGITVTQFALRGRRAATLLDYALSVGADLISTGTHGRGFVSRAIVGSVTAKLLRGAACSILTVPRDPLPAIVTTPREREAVQAFDAPLGWTRLLVDFTRRNLGRRTILEIDDLEIGAQAQEYNYPLLGASYDARDGRLALMFGDRGAGGRHLSRSIGDVAGVDILTDGSGRDIALRVLHGTSQTLLTFAKHD